MSLEGSASLNIKATMDPAGVSVRNYLSSQHLWLAQSSTRQCRELEEKLTAAGYDKGAHPTHRSLALAAIMTSASFLEAWVNEVLQDAAELAPGRSDALSEKCRTAMAVFWNSGERDLNLLAKYDLGLACADQSTFNHGTNPYQAAHLLVSLRNACVHFKPEWHTEAAPRNLEKRLQSVVRKSGLLGPNDGSGWTIWALGAPGAEWAYETAKSFADEWSDRMGLGRQYESDMANFEGEALPDGE